MKMIPIANPGLLYKRYKGEIDEAISRCLASGRFILSDEVSAFENEFAYFIGVDHGIGVGSGTEALHLALAACGIGPGDEVITASHTAVATVAAIECAGARPVLVDIEKEYYTLDPARVKEVITDKTRAIVPVHLYGQPADMSALCAIAREYGLKLIEDCAQAHGALYKGKKVGSYGDAAIFSFYPTKNLAAFGDGGIMVTSVQTIADKARLLRQYGWRDRYISEIPGWNTRLDEIQAAVLRVQLRYLSCHNEERRAHAARYTQLLSNVACVCPLTRQNAEHVYHVYAIQLDKRDEARAFLAEQGVGSAVQYPLAVHQQPAYKHCVRTGADLSCTENIVKRILSLPIYPGLSEDDIQKVAKGLRDFLAK